MSTLKEQLRAALNDSIKSKNELEKTTLRNALGAVQSAEKAGKVEQDFNDEQVQQIIAKEVKKRRDTAQEYTTLVAKGGLDAARAEHLSTQAARESAEAEVLATYLPKQIEGAELEAIVAKAIADTGATSAKEMGAVMKAVKAEVGNAVDGKALSELVRAKLA